MKKYISPVAETIVINTETVFLAGSDPTLEKVDLQDNNFADDQYEILSNRRNSGMWDE